jgi:uncharacterized BrkB/YihY/UPF0761 family membrane protein
VAALHTIWAADQVGRRRNVIFPSRISDGLGMGVTIVVVVVMVVVMMSDSLALQGSHCQMKHVKVEEFLTSVHSTLAYPSIFSIKPVG